MKQGNEKETKMKSAFTRYMAVSLVIVSVILLGLIFYIGILPIQYFILLTGVVGGIDAALFISLWRGKRSSIFSAIISFLLLIVMILGIVYEINTVAFLQKIGKDNIKTEEYTVLVRKEASYEKAKDLTDKLVGILSKDGKELEGGISKKVSVKLKEYESIDLLQTSLLEEEVEAIVMEKSYYEILVETDETFDDKVKELFQFTVYTKESNIAKSVDITKDAFNLYISGIDTYGSVSNVSRSDVNIIATVNPKEHKILLTSIPRDYYVQLHGTTGNKDKLTHAGIYGVDMSVKTLEDLLDTEINYFVKVNFSSLENIVEALEGVTVNSEREFTTIDGHHFTQGKNKVNGKEALAFCRERKAFLEGDRMRGKNQQAMISAIIDKAVSPSILLKYNELLDSLESSFKTNLTHTDIVKFIKMQINHNDSWDVQNQSLDGGDGSEYTYTVPTQKAYVMLPYEDSVASAKNGIKEALGK